MTIGSRFGIVGVGYEGKSIDDFVADLVSRRVARVVDVRMTPISRKPGFSKSALSRALAAGGIRYEHRRELGNPKENRPGFSGSEEQLAAARAVYVARLQQPDSLAALDALGQAARTELVALLCFEADEVRCHRQLVLHALTERMCYRLGQ
ncbi:Protein of unknown function, DUF488 [Micromonospora echinospora]|uniref:DUF488 domain-containing protein n=2 Tax=Micromonospora echinospora TaxID=1877 RepID=A0A1C4Y4I6_MICEC|nr:Protein of unknown function, DUF488 [Micromonospora echinospora]